MVSASGTRPATSESIAVAEIHFEVQIDARVTGFEATQASVPASRSRAIRLPTTKIVAMTKIWAEIATSRLSAGVSDLSCSTGISPAGRTAARRLMMNALAEASSMNAAVTARTTQARLPRTHSVVSLRTRARRPANGPNEREADAVSAPVMIEAVMPHAPSCR